MLSVLRFLRGWPWLSRLAAALCPSGHKLPSSSSIADCANVLLGVCVHVCARAALCCCAVLL